jgi:hypothetical protein
VEAEVALEVGLQAPRIPELDVVEPEGVAVVVASNIPLRLGAVEAVALAQLSAAALQPVAALRVLVGNWPSENRMSSLPRRVELFSNSSN